MTPWVLLDTAPVPGEAGTLRLLRRGAEFSIRIGHNELMNSRLSGSEQALATLACARIVGRPGARVLVGGLGMGFTLKAALAALKADACVIVAELVPAVVAWGRGPMAHLSSAALDDPRVAVREVDVACLIGAATSHYDAVLLDVDNGPEALTRLTNDGLYTAKGLRAASSALRPGGVLAMWSAGPDQRFSDRLRGAGFEVEEVTVRANGAGGGARHRIWLAARTRDIQAGSSDKFRHTP